MLTLWSAAAGCNNRMPMCIGSFSLHSKWIGLSKRYPNSSVLRRDVESDRLIGNLDCTSQNQINCATKLLEISSKLWNSSYNSCTAFNTCWNATFLPLEISWHPQHVIALTTTLLQPIYTPAAWMTVNQYRQCHILAASLLSSHETGHVWKSPSMLWIWMGFSSTVGDFSVCALCVLRCLNKREVKTGAREKGIICWH